MDDDLEGIFQCVPCLKKHCIEGAQLVELPRGSLALIAEDARKRMVKQQAFLWSVNTSNNPYYMCHKITDKNGLCHLPQKVVHALFVESFCWTADTFKRREPPSKLTHYHEPRCVLTSGDFVTEVAMPDFDRIIHNVHQSKPIVGLACSSPGSTCHLQNHPTSLRVPIV